MTEPTINDLHVLLVEQKGDTKLLLSKMEDFSKWKDEHKKEDDKVHDDLHERISDMKKYGGSISIVAIVIGWFLGIKFK